MKTYTPQMLNSFTKCPKEYYYKFVAHVNTPQLESHFVVGKKIHAIASYYLKGEDISIYELNQTETNMWNNILSSNFFRMHAEKIETNVATKIENFWIGGRLDALVKDEHDNYYILDYKTGEIPQNIEDNYQTIIYMLCCNNLLKSYNSLNFVYISAKTGECKSLKFTNELYKKFEYKIKSVCDTINSISQTDIPRKQRGLRCAQCQYSKICK